MGSLKAWMRIVGASYLLSAVMMATVRTPILSAGPTGALTLDAIARFLVDTWIGFGLEAGAIGSVLFIASWWPNVSTNLVWAVLAIELARGIAYELYMLAGIHNRATSVVWILIHAAIILTGLIALQRASRGRAVSLRSSPDSGA